jgi:hypothetical protein
MAHTPHSKLWCAAEATWATIMSKRPEDAKTIRSQSVHGSRVRATKIFETKVGLDHRKVQEMERLVWELLGCPNRNYSAGGAMLHSAAHCAL